MQTSQWLATVFLCSVMTLVHADAPVIKTPKPVIYLADNLDEKDKLGWCIDTLGRGFAERLQAHSCKPRGGDVQFSFDGQTGLIQSVEYKDYCVEIKPDAQTTFALENCDFDIPEQRFTYELASGEFRPAGQPEKCIIVGTSSRSAGPFMSRELLLEDCSTTDIAFKKWILAK